MGCGERWTVSLRSVPHSLHFANNASSARVLGEIIKAVWVRNLVSNDNGTKCAEALREQSAGAGVDTQM
jgi:hypothetical protein